MENCWNEYSRRKKNRYFKASFLRNLFLESEIKQSLFLICLDHLHNGIEENKNLPHLTVPQLIYLNSVPHHAGMLSLSCNHSFSHQKKIDKASSLYLLKCIDQSWYGRERSKSFGSCNGVDWKLSSYTTIK